MNKFAVIDETVIPDQPAAKQNAAAAAQMVQATKVLNLALATIGQRFVIAVSSLFTAGALVSAWWLWSTTLPNPTTPQLIGLGMYALFILMIEGIRRR